MLRIKQLLAFLEEIEKFKVLERRTYTSNLQRKESDAEHTWHLIMFIWLFAAEFKEIVDLFKTFKIALIHDLAEIYAGDPSPFEANHGVDKHTLEDVAFERLLKQLPPDLELEFAELYKEYRDQTSAEAKIVKAYDKVQATWQNVTSNGKFWHENAISFEDVVNYSTRFLRTEDHSDVVYREVLEEVKKRKLL